VTGVQTCALPIFQRRAIADNERLELESRRLRLQLREALAAFEDPAAAEQDAEPETTAEPEAEETEERSWYGLPNADAA